MTAELPPDPSMDPALARLVEGLDAAAERAPSPANARPAQDDPLVAAVVNQLRSPATWDGPPAHLRDTVLARALAERPAAQAVAAASAPSAAQRPVLVPRWRRLAWAVPLTAAASVVFTLLVLTGERLLTQPDQGTSYALAGGSYAQRATGTIAVSSAPGGFAVVLKAKNLPGAPVGYYYQAWLIKTGQQPVSLGTFHGRKTGQPIKLWSGVDPAGYSLTVSLQSVNDPPKPTSQVALTAKITG